MPSAVQVLEIQIPHEIIQYWEWFLAFGVGLLVLGVTAVARAVVATVISVLLFGWLLLFASAIEIAQTIMVGRWAGFFSQLVAAILFGVAGLLIVVRPLISVEVATAFMAKFFMVGGLFKLVGSLAVALPAGVGKHWTESLRS